jgi:uncharacterized protein YukE
MPSAELHFKYQDLEAMEQLLARTAQQLNDTLQKVNMVASGMEGGGYQGKAADTLAEAMKGPLSNSIKKLIEEVLKSQKNLDAAGKEMQKFDQQGAAGFNN